MSLKAGATARLVQPEVQGLIAGRRINDTTDDIELLLQWTDSDGQPQQRWFPESQLQEVQS